MINNIKDAELSKSKVTRVASELASYYPYNAFIIIQFNKDDMDTK